MTMTIISYMLTLKWGLFICVFQAQGQRIFIEGPPTCNTELNKRRKAIGLLHSMIKMRFYNTHLIVIIMLQKTHFKYYKMYK